MGSAIRQNSVGTTESLLQPPAVIRIVTNKMSNALSQLDRFKRPFLGLSRRLGCACTHKLAATKHPGDNIDELERTTNNAKYVHSLGACSLTNIETAAATAARALLMTCH